MPKPDFRKIRMPVEIEELNRGTSQHGISVKLTEKDNKLIATVPGPKDSYYDKGIFELAIEFNDSYPFYPPSIKFISPVYHPNIDETGIICLDVLKSSPQGTYNPALTLESILISIQLLLSNPNPDDPLRADLAEEYKYNVGLFAKKAIEQTRSLSSSLVRPELQNRKRKNEYNLP